MIEKKILQDDEDFLVEVIDWRGRPAVKKSIKPSTQLERIKRLNNEVYGLEFFANLADNHPQIKLYVPSIYEQRDGVLVREYIDRPAVGDNPNNLERLAQLLADIDHIEPYGEAKIIPNFDYQNIRNRFPVWTEKGLQSGLIKQAQLDRANQIIDSHERFLQPRITHGDLSPYSHAFMMEDGRIALLDQEVFTPRGARYYDVARCYIRLYQAAKSPDVARKFLSDFLQSADKVEHQTEQLMTIMVQRTIGMQRDAAIDQAKGDDYRNQAAELLKLVLQDRLELLHN